MSSENNNLKLEIKTLHENIDNSKKETNFFMKEAKKIEKNLENVSKENQETKLKYEKLHKITHGRFGERKKSLETFKNLVKKVI